MAFSIHRTSNQPAEASLGGAGAAGPQVLTLALGWGAPDVQDQREDLRQMLAKAGFRVLPESSETESASDQLRSFRQAVQQADCSLLLLGGAYGEPLPNEGGKPLARLQYELAVQQTNDSGGKHRLVVWHNPSRGGIQELEQQHFLNEIQNTLASHILYSTQSAPAQFIQDLRVFLAQQIEQKQYTQEYDIAFICTREDAGASYTLAEQLGEHLKLETLTVNPEEKTDYREAARELILRSRLVLVYFKEGGDWAVSFVKQVWKQLGGAASGAPFLLLGEDEPRRNRLLEFTGPQILTAVVPQNQLLTTAQHHYQRVRNTGRLNVLHECPYTGLRPFVERESIFFKGRERHVDTISEMLEAEKFVMVTGSSGDGKSSLVFAGLVPNLKGGFLRSAYSKWAVADFRPERSPLSNLADALARELRTADALGVENQLSYGFSALVDLYKESPLYLDKTSEDWLNATEEEKAQQRKQAANLLILVDQFEEFFTNTENYRDGVASPTAQITVNVLQETVRLAREQNLPIYVIFTMRSDYIGQCVAFRGFAELIGQSTYFVPRLNREELQEVIQAPAQLNGDLITPRLVQRILNDLGDGLDQLPVLQHALHQIWTTAQAAGEPLDLLHYAKVGGLASLKLPDDLQPTFDNWLESLPQERRVLYERPSLRNILNRHANELYLESHTYANRVEGVAISPDQARRIVRVAFTCLTRIDDNRAVRNRMELQEIAAILDLQEVDTATLNHVLRVFREPGNTFLQPFVEAQEPLDNPLPPDAVLDITHEALIRNWRQLVEWAEEEAKSVEVYREFKAQVDQWIDNDCSPRYLLNAGNYSYFNAWYERQQPNKAWIRRYISPAEVAPELSMNEQAALYMEDVEEYLELSRRKLQRSKRVAQVAVGIITLLMLIAVSGYYRANLARQAAEDNQELALANAAKAQEQREIAEMQRREAENQRIAAENAKLQAEDAKLLAEEEALKAEQQRRAALGQKLEAEKQRRLAEIQRQRAEKERQMAENQKSIAENQRVIAEKQKSIAEKQKQLAQNALKKAEANRLEASMQQVRTEQQKNNALVLQSLFLSSLAEEQVNKRQPMVGMLLALEGLPRKLQNPNRPFVAECEAALYYSLNSLINNDPLARLQGHRNKVIYNAFSPNGNRVVTTSWDKTARVWDVQTGQLLQTLKGHRHIVTYAAFSQTGRYLVTVAEDFSARVWDLDQGAREAAVFKGHRGKITHAAISPNGERIVTTSEDQTARIWNVAQNREEQVFKGHFGALVQAAFSPDGKLLVTASADGTARLWNLETGQQRFVLKGHNGEINRAVFSPTGQRILTVSDDNTARVWDVATGKQTQKLEGHRASVLYGDFSHDAGRVLTASADGTLRVWEVASGEPLGNMKGHQDAVYYAAFSPDDKRIVSSSLDNTSRLWDADSYLRLSTYYGHPTPNYYATFSPNSEYLAMADGENAVRILEVFPNLQDLIDYGYQLKARNLTQEEKETFFLLDKRVQREVEQAQFLQMQRERQRLLREAGKTDTALQAEIEALEQSTTLETLERSRELQRSRRLGDSDKAANQQPNPAARTPSANTAPTSPQPSTSPSTAQAPRQVQAAPQPTTTAAADPAGDNQRSLGTYTVLPAETLYRIARKHNMTVKELKELNNLNSNVLQAGEILKVYEN